ncbi:MAG: NUDIX domain-containing protein [Bacteriovorax sp.]|nr:NUDIX domain-containing protein [Bacteriovorax sp.]
MQFSKDQIPITGNAGGVEGAESPAQAASREAFEEAGIQNANLIVLDSICCMPADIFRDWKHWPKETYVVKEFSFGVKTNDNNFVLSDEHTESRWCSYDEAISLLKWDSNKTALWELYQRLNNLA